MKRALLIATIGLLALPLSAHHSTAMFDTGKELVLDAVIKEMQWTNPHGWLIVMATGADGATTQWSIETAPPSMLERFGIKKSDFKAGEKVSVHTHPIRDGQPIGLFMSLVRADGTVVSPKAN
ncbi:MAG: DUF6152 family protein [Steroidobacteraceae bacterium]